MDTIDYDHFQRFEIRVGRVERAEPFPEARRPSLKLWVDFGDPLGVKKTSAQLADNYSPESLRGRCVVAITNFAPKQIGTFMSEVLVLGVPDQQGQVVLLVPDRPVPLGGRMY
jgi:tRNA-binding protein